MNEDDFMMHSRDSEGIHSYVCKLTGKQFFTDEDSRELSRRYSPIENRELSEEGGENFRGLKGLPLRRSYEAMVGLREVAGIESGIYSRDRKGYQKLQESIAEGFHREVDGEFLRAPGAIGGGGVIYKIIFPTEKALERLNELGLVRILE